MSHSVFAAVRTRTVAYCPGEADGRLRKVTVSGWGVGAGVGVGVGVIVGVGVEVGVAVGVRDGATISGGLLSTDRGLPPPLGVSLDVDGGEPMAKPAEERRMMKTIAQPDA